MSEKILHLLVKGRVQGVGFRWHIASEARRLGLAGWVRNNLDGTVELCAAGKAEALATLEAVAANGPPGARVSAVEKVHDQIAEPLPNPFSIGRE